mmetsp:Transcript_15016/g.43363  ORF Transcript_15016/g.43363 Transcript_15016/m.43363 type:complete len:221 (-) Transcript_15016:286-948(-)
MINRHRCYTLKVGVQRTAPNVGFPHVHTTLGSLAHSRSVRFRYRKSPVSPSFPFQEFLCGNDIQLCSPLRTLERKEVPEISVLVSLIFVQQIQWHWRRQYQGPIERQRNDKDGFKRHSNVIPAAAVRLKRQILRRAAYLFLIGEWRNKLPITSALRIVPIGQEIHVHIAIDMTSLAADEGWSLRQGQTRHTSCQWRSGLVRIGRYVLIIIGIRCCCQLLL